jgi:tetratricopeptide (TPR) repeat protein
MISSLPSFHRYVALICLSLIFIFVGWKSSEYLISQVHLLKAEQYLRSDQLDLVILHLNKALNYEPSDLNIRIALGTAFFQIANTKTMPVSMDYIQKAKTEYELATGINPYDAEAMFNLAVAEGALEILYPYDPDSLGENPHNAIPYYEQALRLWPSADHIYYHYIKYLSKRGEERLLHESVKNLARISPENYYHLKKETFWSQDLRSNFKVGLQLSIDNNILKNSALLVMTKLLEDEENWIGAIQYYRKFVNLNPQQITAAKYLKLGKLYLKTELFDEAESVFLKSVHDSFNFDKDYKNIINIYRNKKMIQELYQFHEKVGRSRSISAKTEIYVAKSLISIGDVNKAVILLNRLATEASNAEASHILAQLAGKEKAWGRAQEKVKAAIDLDPENADYRMFLSKVLLQLDRKIDAEYEASVAIEQAGDGKDRFYIHRAHIRSGINNLLGALEDFESAIELSPENHAYYAWAANINEKLGDLEKAVAYYKKASEFSKNSKRYVKKIEALESKILSNDKYKNK